MITEGRKVPCMSELTGTHRQVAHTTEQHANFNSWSWRHGGNRPVVFLCVLTGIQPRPFGGVHEDDPARGAVRDAQRPLIRGWSLGPWETTSARALQSRFVSFLFFVLKKSSALRSVVRRSPGMKRGKHNVGNTDTSVNSKPSRWRHASHVSY